MNEETITEIAEVAAKEPTEVLTARVTELEGQITARDTELSEAVGAAEGPDVIGTLKATIAALQAENTAAVTAYRKLAVSSNPTFTEELITGSTIADVDASVKKVNELAAGIKSRLEAELKAIVIPAGAPERSGPDTSGLSPREKIKAGIQNK